MKIDTNAAHLIDLDGIQVLLDGKVVKDAFVADEEAGYVVVPDKSDVPGVMEPFRFQSPFSVPCLSVLRYGNDTVKVLTGKVEIRLADYFGDTLCEREGASQTIVEEMPRNFATEVPCPHCGTGVSATAERCPACERRIG